MSAYQPPAFHQLTPAAEINRRLDEAQAGLMKHGFDAALIIQPVDLFYFTGTMQSGHLLLPARGDPLLMVRRDLDRAQVESPVPAVGLASLAELARLVNDRLGAEPGRLGLELDVLPVKSFKRYQELWPRAEFTDVSPLILEQRAVKSEYEAACLRRAGELSRRVYAAVPGFLRPGLTEIEAAGLMTKAAYQAGHQNYLRTRGFDQAMYSWHVISGPSGGIPSFIDAAFGGYGLSPAFPAGASLKTIAPGEPVLIDFGLCLDGYQVDLTRMFSIGPPPGLITEAYEALAEIEVEMSRRLRPGQTGHDLYYLAVARAEKLGFGHAFLGPPERKARFAGHGVGLEISDPPLLAPGFNTPLLAGMVVALELKMVFPGLAAVGLENTFRIGNGEPEKLTLADDRLIVI
ncbi:MAG: Xaa-Pro peptidase family protein [Thermodesulfobacteriota bacterium]